jgi:RHS repeat-associated protein
MNHFSSRNRYFLAMLIAWCVLCPYGAGAYAPDPAFAAHHIADFRPQVSVLRRVHMTDHVGTTTWTVDEMGRITTETGSFGTAPVVAQYDDLGRMTNISFDGHSVDYAYDGLGRITGIHAPEGDYAFAYMGAGVRRTQVDYPNGVTAALGYDSLKRLDSLDYVRGTHVLLLIDYQYDAGDRRTNEIWSMGREVGYGYDLAHQLTLADSSLPSDSAAYRYDRIGNPLERTELGLGVTNAFNNLNQIVSGVATGGVMSLTVSGGVNYHVGTVMVNNVEADFDPQTKTFRLEGVELFPGTNVLEAVYYGPPITNAGHVATSTVTVVLGETTYVHDDNGKLIEDANFHYQFDLANQLTNVVSKETAQSVFSARYDGMNRRVEVTRNGTVTERYVYFPASFNVLAVLDATNGVKEVYTHGPDLSGSLGGAGGIGGILHVTPLLGGAGGGFFYHADAMGNVLLTTDASGETTSTHRYTPFGRPITSTGSYQPRFGFSSKEYDSETGLNYFGYRYLVVSQGRWLNRDPLGEVGGINLYGFVLNNGLYFIDPLGLCEKPGAAQSSSLWDRALTTLESWSWQNQVAEQQYAQSHAAYVAANPASQDIKAKVDTVFVAATLFLPIKIGGVTRTANNPIPSNLQFSRTVSADVAHGIQAGAFRTLGNPRAQDVFITAADDIAGLSRSATARRLTVPQSDSAFRIDFTLPNPSGLASPINRSNPGFIQGGRTAGGAREFVVPNLSLQELNYSLTPLR